MKSVSKVGILLRSQVPPQIMGEESKLSHFFDTFPSPEILTFGLNVDTCLAGEASQLYPPSARLSGEKITALLK